MSPLAELVRQIRIALATHPKVTVNHPQPKRLWRALKKELPVCDVTFDERAVYVTWKVIDEGRELLELSPEERFVQPTRRASGELEEKLKRSE